MAEKIKADVQLPVFAYRLLFRDPHFDLQELDRTAVSAAFAAFRPWNVSLENVVFNENATNLAEEATSFTLLRGKITFSVNPGGCGLVVSNPNWSEAPLIVQIGSAGVAAVLAATGAVPEKHVGSITMHLTPSSGTIRDITSKFVNVDLSRVAGGTAQSFGFSAYRDDLLWVVDRSVPFPNSLFVRLDRAFRGEETLEGVARQLNADETALLDLLGLEVD